MRETYPLGQSRQLLEVAAAVGNHIRRNHVHLDVGPVLLAEVLVLVDQFCAHEG